jgi:small-conductance mechanosensitive channel
MEHLFKIVTNTTGISRILQIRLINTLVIILILWIIRIVIGRLVYRKYEDVKTRYVWMKTVTYITVVLGIILICSVWFRGFKALGTYLGILSAGLAIALKDPLANLAGWVFLIFRRSFGVGDRIQIGDKAGDVIDIRMFQFILLEIGNWVDADQSTGRVIYVPNGLVFTLPLANYSKGFQYIWNELNVLLTFESNWQKAKEILGDIANKHAENLGKAAERKVKEASKKFMIFYKSLTPTVYTSVKDSGIQLTIRYLCEPRKRRGTEEAIWEEILTEFGNRKDIDFAYPTVRYYDSKTEGKGPGPAEVY